MVNIKLRDNVKFNFNKDDIKVKYNKIVNDASGDISLLVEFASTHAGILTENDAFYLPRELSKATKSMTTPYQKPIIKNHDSSEDPIGRVKYATYVDTSEDIVSKYPRLKPLVNSRSSMKKMIDAAKIIVKDIYKQDKSYQGLGYIKIGAEITDQEAIKKFLDGRYLTCSTSKSVSDVYCSICGKNWAEEMCEHYRGDKDSDGVSFFRITAGEDFKEVSIVNNPADPFGMVISKQFSDAEEPIEKRISPNREHTSEVPLKCFSVVRDKEESSIFNLEEETPTKIDTSTKEFSDYQKVFEVQDAEDSGRGDPEESDADPVKTVAEFIALTPEKSVETLNTILDKTSQLEIKDTQLFYKDTEDKDLEALTYFCGPNCTFPADDIALAEASLVLIEDLEENDARTVIKDALKGRLKLLKPEKEEQAAQEINLDSLVLDTKTAVLLLSNIQDTSLLIEIKDLALKAAIWNGFKEEDCKECKTKDSLVAILQANYDSERIFSTKLLKKINDFSKDTSTEDDSVAPDSPQRVENPTVPTKQDQRDSEGEEEAHNADYYRDNYSGFYKEYEELRFVKGHRKAEQFLFQKKAKGLIPKDAHF